MTIWIVAGGPNISTSPLLEAWRTGDFVIAADGGADILHAIGRRPDLLVGDLDSIDPNLCAELASAGVDIDQHPRDKDASDLALALDAACSQAADVDAAAAVVLVGDGGRIDHQLANLMVLASTNYRSLHLVAHVGSSIVTPVHRQRTLRGVIGDVVSLFAVGGPATGVHTSGLAFALDNDVVPPAVSLGLSNVFSAPEAEVRLSDGVLLAIQPGAIASARS